MLSALGRREEALKAAEETVGLRRVLVAARPDASIPDLARSLSNLGNGLGDLGRREDALKAAEEAVGPYRPLACGTRHLHPRSGWLAEHPRQHARRSGAA